MTRKNVNVVIMATLILLLLLAMVVGLQNLGNEVLQYASLAAMAFCALALNAIAWKMGFFSRR